MHLPKFSDLADEQLDVYLHSPDESMLVVGPPGSGKTSMAIWRGRYLASPPVSQSIRIVTKNRLLAAAARALALEESGMPLHASTMHKFVSEHYWSVFRRYAPKINDYDFDWELILHQYAAAGVTANLDHIIVDEGQNLPSLFFVWAMRFGARIMSVFADEDQTTDRQNTTIADLRLMGFGQVFPLLLNHRNSGRIANLVEAFHINRVIPPASVRRGPGTAPSLIQVHTWEDLADTVSNRYRNQRQSIGVIVYRTSEVKHMASLIRRRLPIARVDEYTYQTEHGEEFGIQVREEGVTIISGESAIGLEFDTVYLQDLSRSLPVSDVTRARRLYMLCARARDFLYLVNGPQILLPVQIAALPTPPILER